MCLHAYVQELTRKIIWPSFNSLENSFRIKTRAPNSVEWRWSFTRNCLILLHVQPLRCQHFRPFRKQSCVHMFPCRSKRCHVEAPITIQVSVDRLCSLSFSCLNHFCEHILSGVVHFNSVFSSLIMWLNDFALKDSTWQMWNHPFESWVL